MLQDLQDVRSDEADQTTILQLRHALGLATKAMDETAELGLEFETYLLEMAVVALTEKLESVSESDAR